MKGLKSWIWIGCLCLGITLTVCMPEILQSSSGWLAMKSINSNSSTILLRKNYTHVRLFTKLSERRGENYVTLGPTDSMNHGVVPIKVFYRANKRSVKRGEVNYYDNSITNSILRNSNVLAFKNVNTQNVRNDLNENLDEYTKNPPVKVKLWTEGPKFLASGNSVLKRIAEHSVKFMSVVMRKKTKGHLIQIKNNGNSRYFPENSISKLNERVFIMRDRQNRISQHCSVNHSKWIRSESIWRQMAHLERNTRYKRMTDNTSNQMKDYKKTREHNTQKANYRQMMIARRKQVQDQRLRTIRNRRLQLKNIRKNEIPMIMRKDESAVPGKPKRRGETQSSKPTRNRKAVSSVEDPHKKESVSKSNTGKMRSTKHPIRQKDEKHSKKPTEVKVQDSDKTADNGQLIRKHKKQEVREVPDRFSKSAKNRKMSAEHKNTIRRSSDTEATNHKATHSERKSANPMRSGRTTTQRRHPKPRNNKAEENNNTNRENKKIEKSQTAGRRETTAKHRTAPYRRIYTNENYINERNYMGRLLGLGLGSREPWWSRIRTRPWSRSRYQGPRGYEQFSQPWPNFYRASAFAAV